MISATKFTGSASLAALGLLGVIANGEMSMAEARTPAEIFQAVAPSVWMVKTTNANSGLIYQGSAVVIGKRRLATACHVVNGASSVAVTHDKDEQRVEVARTITDPDPEHDICVLTTNTDIGAPAVELAPIATVKVGDPVYAIGSPLGLELTLTDGLVSALRTNEKGEVRSIQASAAIAHGSSGGGLFDKEGRLIGITVASASETSEALGFAIPAQVLIDLPERRGSELAEWRALLSATGVRLDANGAVIASGYAAITDISAIPMVGPRVGVEAAYRQFLLKASPRAFVVTSDGQWGTVASVEALNQINAQCAARKVQCAVYAVDNAVVWTGKRP